MYIADLLVPDRFFVFVGVVSCQSLRTKWLLSLAITALVILGLSMRFTQVLLDTCNRGVTTTTHLRFTLVFLTVARWSIDIYGIFVTFAGCWWLLRDCNFFVKYNKIGCGYFLDEWELTWFWVRWCPKTSTNHKSILTIWSIFLSCNLQLNLNCNPTYNS
jgi:hypothetical protein